jgi:hypothetical protein
MACSPASDSPKSSLSESATTAEQVRQHTVTQLQRRQHDVQLKLDRGYEDYVEGKIPEALWLRKSPDWESDLASIEAAILRQSQPIRPYQVEGERF